MIVPSCLRSYLRSALLPTLTTMLLVPPAMAGIFKIRPYVIKNHKNENVLKFTLSRSRDLSISAQHTTPEGTKDVGPADTLYKAYTQYDINLGPQPCGTTTSYQMVETAKPEVKLAEMSIPSYSCDPKGEITFGFLADTQENRGHYEVSQVIEKNFKENMSFLLQGGDIVHFGAKDSQWISHFSEGSKYYDKIPMIAAIGNHEYWYSYIKRGSSYFFRRYMRSEGDPESYNLAFDFPQFTLLVFNSNFEKVGWDDQWTWLKDNLKLAKDNQKKVILVMHHSPFTSERQQGLARGATLRNKMVPILEKAGNVALVLSGHEHIYERSFKENIHYLVAGPAGGRKYPAVVRNPYRKFVDDRARTFSLLKVKDGKIAIKTFDYDSKVIDQLEIPL